MAINKKMNPEKIIYSICIEDVQNVAEEEFGRKLTQKELEIVEDKIGDYFPWFDNLADLLRMELKIED